MLIIEGTYKKADVALDFKNIVSRMAGVSLTFHPWRQCRTVES